MSILPSQVKEYSFIVRSGSKDNSEPSSFLRLKVVINNNEVTKNIPMSPEFYSKFVENPDAYLKNYNIDKL
ncbi:unnamed protein product [Auanema sp. JU1783]|nr:unnamed protein product [Auanema sp. JU1783]